MFCRPLYETDGCPAGVVEYLVITVQRFLVTRAIMALVEMTFIKT